MLQAAIEHGIEVPYYCYHPGLGIDGNCRVCLVKIEKMPKLQVSCSVTAADGMVVHTHTPDVVEARAGCSSSCSSTIRSTVRSATRAASARCRTSPTRSARDDSRMEFPRRTFDGEGVKADVDFGPTLMLNRNRCILCTRCIRFMRDVDGDAQIGIVDRGYGSEIATFEEQGVHSLLSGNLMDVCPVGAITTRDYRFKSRPWDNPSAVDTICTLCEKGCNTTAWIKAKPEWAKGAQLVRFTPRFNPDVNGYWMCDIGRFDYHWIEGDERLTQPLAANGAAGTPGGDLGRRRSEAAGRADAAGGAAAGAARSCSRPTPSTKSCSSLARLGAARARRRRAGRLAVTWTTSEKPQPADTKFTMPTVNAPNVAGARDAWPDLRGPGRGRRPAALRADVEAGRVSALYVFDPGPEGRSATCRGLSRPALPAALPALIVQGVLMTALAPGRRPGAARRLLRREGRVATPTCRVGCSSPRAPFPPPGEALDDTLIVLRVAAAARRRADYRDGRRRPRDIAATLPDEPGLQGIADADLPRPGGREALAAGEQPVRAREVGHAVPGSAAREVRRDAEAAAGGHVIPLRPVDE